MNEEKNQNSNILSTSHKFAKNSIYNVMGFMVTFPILILLTPYMLNVLGKAQFGIWAIAGVVTSYAQLSDMGMTTAIVKFVAEHWKERDVNRINSIVSTAFFSFAVVGAGVVGGILLLRYFIVMNLLEVPPELQAEAVYIVTGVIIIFYFNLLFSVYNSVLLGIQRMDVTNAISTTSKILRAMGMYLFLVSGFGLKGLIINGAIFSALTIAANVIWARKLTKDLSVHPFWFSFAELWRIIKYSVNMFIVTLVGLGQDPLNKIILAASTSLSFVSFYEIGNRVKDTLRQLFQVALMPLLPASSELKNERNKRELEVLFLSSSRMLYLFAVPSFFLVIVVAEPLVRIWLGDGYTFAARAIQFLLVGNLFSLLISPQYIILYGIGRPWVSTLVSAINGSANIILALILVPLFGYFGVLLAVLVSLFLSSILMIYLFHRTTRYSLIKYIQSLPWKLLAIVSVLTGCTWIISLRINDWMSFFMTVMSFFVFLLVAILMLLKEDEKELIKRIKLAFFPQIQHDDKIA